MTIHQTDVLHTQIALVSVAMGVVVILALIFGITIANLISEGKTSRIPNPFAPVIRAFERWQEHRYVMKELEQKHKLRRLDPDYTSYLEKRGD